MPRPALTTTQRGYGSRHQAERNRWSQVIARTGAVCWRCHRPILPGMAWDLGHHDWDRSVYMGPEHRRCNRSAGARKAALLRRSRGRTATSQTTTSARW